MKIQNGIDNVAYMVFDTPEQADAIAETLNIQVYSCGNFGNAVALDDYIAKTTALVAALPATINALSETHELVDRVGRQAETPICWSFHERDTARENGRLALKTLNTVLGNA